MKKFINYLETIREQKKPINTQLYLSSFAILLFLGLILTFPIIYKQFNKNQNITKSQASGNIPEFWIDTSSGSHNYSTYTQVNATTYTVDDAYVSATITDLGGGLWNLTINQAKTAISSVTFPWQSQRTPLDSDISDDIFYYPYIMGMTRKASDINTDWTWWGFKYPGDIALPLVVMADNDDAKIVAATNWPPKTVTPHFAAQRMVLEYDQPIPVNGSASYGALIATVTGNASTGDVPWQHALDLYKSWLGSAMGPVSYPSWMWHGQGILDIQVQNINDTQYSTAYIDSIWQPVKSLYPWMLMWGQMSPYAGGCCEPLYTMHNHRYLRGSSLPDYVKNTVAAGGYHAGYYSAPYWPDPTNYSLDTQAGVDWLTGWLDATRGYNANSFYIDTLARQYWGEAAAVKNLMDNNTIPQESMLEGAVDIYPRAALISGSLTGDSNACGAPYMRPENYTTTSFPNFVRYALGDRLIYEGQANTDWKFWGTDQGWTIKDTQNNQCGYTAYCSANGPCDYGTERLAFLLGAKIDVQLSSINGNSILDAINAERIRVSWWTRKPVYLDTKGLNLTNIPSTSKVEVSHFQDINGVDLLAVSNPTLVSGLTFQLNGQSIAVPVQNIIVIDTAGTTTPTNTPTPIR